MSNKKDDKPKQGRVAQNERRKIEYVEPPVSNLETKTVKPQKSSSR